jgi:hypothetical protein
MNSIVYVAFPMQVYNTKYSLEMCRRLYDLFPVGTCFYYAASLYSNNDHWKRTWPYYREKSDILVFFTDTKGYIGKGVYTEIQDMLRYEKAVFWLAPSGLVLVDFVDFHLVNEGKSWREYMKVIGI